MNAKARAVLSPDGKSWILNGEKMWLTNAGFADLYITFAKVDGEHFTAFIIEKGMPACRLGHEEKKTGIKGSSTRPLILADAVVPKENLLGEIGKAHKIAFNVLNIGRFKLGAGVTGGAKLAIGQAAQYAKGRMAFGHPISDFGLIKHKLGEMAILAYVSESLVYRTAGMIDRNLTGIDVKDTNTCLKRIEEYDVECSIAKVWCSRCWTTSSTRPVQIFASAGFVEDYPAERYWRDARINRIFEGTNEINRLLVPGRLLRRAMKASCRSSRRRWP
jgi:alkylation response protein AidB-like acyl-CoA dehydrogenase